MFTQFAIAQGIIVPIEWRKKNISEHNYEHSSYTSCNQKRAKSSANNVNEFYAHKFDEVYRYWMGNRYIHIYPTNTHEA